MSRDWLLIETLGEEPVVVALGRHMRNFVPLGILLRRNPKLTAVQSVINEVASQRESVSVLVPRSGNRIQAEPVTMCDGRLHGVHLWFGPPDTEPPERPLPGAGKSDLNLESSVTRQFLANVGKDPDAERLTGRPIADDIPSGTMNDGEARALSWAVDLGPGRTFAANWGFRDRNGMHRRVGFCLRIATEKADDGTDQLVGRSMNLLEGVYDSPPTPDQLGQRIIDGMARPGVHRAILDPNSWTLIKWLDEPCPFYDWRSEVKLHPEDRERFSRDMAEELQYGETSAVMRLPANGGGWTPVHVTAHRVELDTDVFAYLVSLRLPTPSEAAQAPFI